ncbi:MAG: hypothetical protein VX871_00895 [Pseudomonadota bacterium]|nr:hypothetical protein [Pseudomonadota bacterium]
MASNELDRLRTLAGYAEQISAMADDSDDARQRIQKLISKAEGDIKSKSMEIQLQRSHISLLKQLDQFLARPADPAPAAYRISGDELNVRRVIGTEN